MAADPQCASCGRIPSAEASVRLAVIQQGPLQKWAKHFLSKAGADSVTCVDCIHNAVVQIIPSRLLPSYFAPPHELPAAEKFPSSEELRTSDSFLPCASCVGENKACTCCKSAQKPPPPPVDDYEICKFCCKIYSANRQIHALRKKCGACSTVFDCHHYLMLHKKTCDGFGYYEENYKPASPSRKNVRKAIRLSLEEEPLKYEDYADCAHRCTHCPMGFKTPMQLSTHEKLGNCYKCLFNLGCSTTLLHHIKNGHPAEDRPKEESEEEEELPFQCTHCESTFALESTLQRHAQTQVCGECKVEFACIEELNVHERISNKKCKHCLMHFHGEQQLQAHKEQNTCLGCHRKFMCKTLAERHIRKCLLCLETVKEKMQKGLKCSYCSKNFADEKSRTAHHEGRFCVCGKELTCETYKKVHMMRVNHSQFKAKQKTSTLSNKHKCVKCPRTFVSNVATCETYKKAHMMKVDHSQLKAKQKTSTLSNKHKCIKCPRTFVSYVGLHLHNVQNHPKNKTAKCNLCKSVLSNDTHLLRHQQSRKCKKCSFTGCWKLVQEHSLTCLGPVVQSQCPHCGETFRSERKHLHSKFVCAKCKSSDFKCFNQLAKHKVQCKVGHKPTICTHCKASLSTSAALTKHTKARFCRKCHWRAPCNSLLKEHQCIRKRLTHDKPIANKPEQQKPTLEAKKPDTVQPLHVAPPPNLAVQGVSAEVSVPKCPYCASACLTTEILQRHMLQSNCPRCSFAQPCSIMLARHLDICQFNPAEVRSTCPLCKNTFASAALLGVHVQTCVVKFTCEFCGKAYPTAIQLNNHKKYRHKDFAVDFLQQKLNSSLGLTMDLSDKVESKFVPVRMGVIQKVSNGFVSNFSSENAVQVKVENMNVD